MTVTVRPMSAADGAQLADLVKEGTGGDARLSWFPVNLTLDAWCRKLGYSTTHQGTLIRTERGVFGCGLWGSFFVGVKGEDGSVVRAPDFTGAVRPDELILEAADPNYGRHGCHRDPATGAIVCKCP